MIALSGLAFDIVLLPLRPFGSALFFTIHIVTHPLDISSGEL